MTADELVALVRETVQPTYTYGADDGPGTPERPEERALMYSDGRVIATDLAIMELLVEIRDLLRYEAGYPMDDHIATVDLVGDAVAAVEGRTP